MSSIEDPVDEYESDPTYQQNNPPVLSETNIKKLLDDDSSMESKLDIAQSDTASDIEGLKEIGELSEDEIGYDGDDDTENESENETGYGNEDEAGDEDIITEEKSDNEDYDDGSTTNIDGWNMPCEGFITYIKRRNDDSNRCDYYIMIPPTIVNKYPQLKNINQFKTNKIGDGPSQLSLNSQPGVQTFVKIISNEDLDEECKNTLLEVNFTSSIDKLTPQEQQLLINTEKREGKKNKDELPDEDSEDYDDKPKDIIHSLEKNSADSDAETDESDDEDIYQKLDADINSTHLVDKHPGVTQHSYAEILTLSKVIRNDKGEIIDELHKTFPFISKYEKAKIIGLRTKQLNNGADPFIDIDSKMIDGYSIATKEFEDKKIPFIIARPLPNGSREYWKMADLEQLHY